MKYSKDLTVKSVHHINEKYVLIILTDDEQLPDMMPGQFVEVRVDGDPNTFLRRPISINDVDTDRNELHLLVAMVGSGTRQLGKLVEGMMLNVMFPLGNGFTLPTPDPQTGLLSRHLLVGGGVGVAPLLFLGRRIKEMGGEPTFLLGARSAADLLLIDRFEEVGRVFITTEDGSKGEKGFVTNHSILNRETFDLISTCGPAPMMKAVSAYAEKANITCEVSLENKMACGLGACLCCVEKTTDKGNICICTEGPVINSKRIWQN
jgi:dihydroorotate dehydrogenase electron transfer subunit